MDITDRIKVKISDLEQIQGAISEYKEYIAGQVLADSIMLETDVKGTEITDMDDIVLNISIEKV